MVPALDINTETNRPDGARPALGTVNFQSTASFQYKSLRSATAQFHKMRPAIHTSRPHAYVQYVYVSSGVIRYYY
jgi:hypothetical protein